MKHWYLSLSEKYKALVQQLCFLLLIWGFFFLTYVFKGSLPEALFYLIITTIIGLVTWLLKYQFKTNFFIRFLSYFVLISLFFIIGTWGAMLDWTFFILFGAISVAIGLALTAISYVD